MTEHEVLAAIGVGEDNDWEFKDARGGLPGSLWETYSGMANTDGGVIVLGVKEKDDVFEVVGLTNASHMRKLVWDNLNDRGKVSVNLLSEGDVADLEVLGKTILVVRVPRADRRQRPVFEGQNPLRGTYRRNYEGDYKCRPDEVGRMLADQAEEPLDSRVLAGFGVDDLDGDSLNRYRERFRSTRPEHPWLSLALPEFLGKLQVARKERSTGAEGITVAGLLMFGTDEAIRDPDAVPAFHLDFRERLSDDPSERWTDRLTADGTWVCNVFQFFHRVITRLTADLRVPFQVRHDLSRIDDTLVHRAVLEALTNALIHADYRGQGGVIVERYRDRLEFSNPGTLLIDIEQILRGGVSECRNRTLQTMFGFLGYGERAGSGWDTIRQGWSSQHWRAPSIEETNRPDRVAVVLPMESLLPQDVLAELRGRFGAKFRRLTSLQVTALAAAFAEGTVSNRRMRELSSEHPTELTRLLQGLASQGFLQQIGQKRGTAYRLVGSGPIHLVGATVGGDSSHIAESSHMSEGESSHKPAKVTEDDMSVLREIARPARLSRRMDAADLRALIALLCDGRFLDATTLGELLDRNVNSLRSRFLTPMVAEGLLVRRFPDEPNRPGQAYRTPQH